MIKIKAKIRSNSTAHTITWARIFNEDIATPYIGVGLKLIGHDLFRGSLATQSGATNSPNPSTQDILISPQSLL